MAHDRWQEDDDYRRRRYGYDDDFYPQDRSLRYGRRESYDERDPFERRPYERGYEYSSLPTLGSNYGGGWRNEYDEDWRRYGGGRDSDYYSREYQYGRYPERGDEWRRESRGGRGWWERTKDELRSWMGDEQAEQRRRMDHRGRGPKGYTRSDERIREDVSDRLMEDWGVDATDIEVQVLGGEVTLSGTVDGRESKRRAEDLAADVLGVRDVQNNLRVRRVLPTGTSAAEIGTGTVTSTTGITGTTSTTTPRH